MSGWGAVNDLSSTNPTECFKATPQARNSEGYKEANSNLIARWQETLDMLNSQTDGRVLRIHVAFEEGYSPNLKPETVQNLQKYGELDANSTSIPAVRVKGNEVCVIIDKHNYDALFTDASLKEGIRRLLKIQEDDAAGSEDARNDDDRSDARN